MEEGGGCRVGYTGYTGCNSKEGREGGYLPKASSSGGEGGDSRIVSIWENGLCEHQLFSLRFCASSEIERRCEMFICFVAAIGSDKCEEEDQGALSTDAPKKNVQPEEFSGQLSLGESSFFLF